MNLLITSNSSVNWDAVSSISNIILSLLTLLAVLVTYRTLIVSTKAKAKIKYKFDTKGKAKFHKIRLVNQRDVPITVIHKGFYIHDEQKREVSIHGERVKEKLYNSDVIYHSANTEALNAKLRKRGHENGEIVNLYGYFIVTNRNKVYRVKFKHKVESNEPSIQSK